jgi:hypothetical protein
MRSGYVVDAVTSGFRLRYTDSERKTVSRHVGRRASRSGSQGPEVELTSVALTIAAEGEISVACDRFQRRRLEQYLPRVRRRLAGRAPGPRFRNHQPVILEERINMNSSDDLCRWS